VWRGQQATSRGAMWEGSGNVWYMTLVCELRPLQLPELSRSPALKNKLPLYGNESELCLRSSRCALPNYSFIFYPTFRRVNACVPRSRCAHGAHA
jgi:hypothetical protein